EDLKNLVSFQEARQAIATGKYTGLGFALGSDNNGGYWQGIDLDDIEDKPALLEIKSSLPGYVEISPSGKGLHAIGYGPKFTNLGSNKSGIEAYSYARFFTVTGKRVNALLKHQNHENVVDIADFVKQRLQPLHSLRGSLSTLPAKNFHVSEEEVTSEIIE